MISSPSSKKTAQDNQITARQYPAPSRLAFETEAVRRVRCEFEDKTWQMFWRIAVDGKNAATIAEELGVTPATVRKAKSRILRRLKQEVGDLDD